MKLFVKNMVCSRCKMVVENELKSLDLEALTVDLGEITFKTPLAADEVKRLEARLNAYGFELLDDKKSQTVEKIKNTLIDLVQKQNGFVKTTLSNYLSEVLQMDYNHLSQLFSQMESTTIEQYYILLKIERVKELLVYGELSIKEIAYALHYSSVAHLSKQFKKVTGLTPTFFKEIKENKRLPLENLQ